jgi:hypothetical protein
LSRQRNAKIHDYLDSYNGENMNQFFICMAITQSVNAQLNLKTDRYEIIVGTPDEVAF